MPERCTALRSSCNRRPSCGGGGDGRTNRSTDNAYANVSNYLSVFFYRVQGKEIWENTEVNEKKKISETIKSGISRATERERQHHTESGITIDAVKSSWMIRSWKKSRQTHTTHRHIISCVTSLEMIVCAAYYFQCTLATSNATEKCIGTGPMAFACHRSHSQQIIWATCGLGPIGIPHHRHQNDDDANDCLQWQCASELANRLHHTHSTINI